MRSPHGYRAVLALVILVGLGLVGSLIGSGHATTRPAGDKRPNIVVIQFDDAVLSDLFQTLHTASGKAPVLPNISKLLIQRGVTFRNYYVSVPLCCPSRTALLTGRYARNNG